MRQAPSKWLTSPRQIHKMQKIYSSCRLLFETDHGYEILRVYKFGRSFCSFPLHARKCIDFGVRVFYFSSSHEIIIFGSHNRWISLCSLILYFAFNNLVGHLHVWIWFIEVWWMWRSDCHISPSFRPCSFSPLAGRTRMLLQRISCQRYAPQIASLELKFSHFKLRAVFGFSKCAYD